MKIDFNQVIKKLGKKANDIYEDRGRLKKLLSSAVKMIEENKQLKEVFDELKTMIQLVKDWIKGDYKDLSKNTIILIIIALLYLVNPLDLIPDFLLVGFIDDIAVIGFIMKRISNEVSKYKEWKLTLSEDIIEMEEYEIDEEIEIDEEASLDDDFYIEL